MVAYHDREWGRPVDDEAQLFEMLSLEGFQAGLSWQTILHKRDSFRRAFKGWDARTVAAFDERDRARLLADAGIVRHAGKIEATIGNAAHLLELVEREGPFAGYLRRFVDWPPRPLARSAGPGDLPAATPAAAALSKDL
jgi:DNA-3-methyladenine glycosylase I